MRSCGKKINLQPRQHLQDAKLCNLYCLLASSPSSHLTQATPLDTFVSLLLLSILSLILLIMKNINRLLGALLLPSVAIAQNSTSFSNTTTDSSSEGLLSSENVELGAWAYAYAKATALVAQLTNEEKVTIITGGSVSSVNWTALEFKDGTQGVQGRIKSCPSNHLLT